MAAPDQQIPWRDRPALRAGEIADLLGVSRTTVGRAIKRHHLTANRRLGPALYPIAEVLRLLDELGLGESPDQAPEKPATRGELCEVRDFMGKR